MHRQVGAATYSFFLDCCSNKGGSAAHSRGSHAGSSNGNQLDSSAGATRRPRTKSEYIPFDSDEDRQFFLAWRATVAAADGWAEEEVCRAMEVE